MRCEYVDGPHGQVHLRRWAPDGASLPPLLCFHPAPFSGCAFEGIAPFLAQDRVVIAPDYPGYGGSSAMKGAPAIGDYADAMIAVAEAAAGGGPVDVLGFHTGCLVAAEVALRRPEGVRKACLIDLPAFPPDQSAQMAEKFAGPVEITPDLDCLAAAWKMGFLSRIESQSVDRAFQMFSEQLRPGRAMNAAFHAAFTYPWAEQLSKIRVETLVLATNSSLLEGSRAGSKVIPSAQLLERLDVKRAVLDEAAQTIAADLNNFLTG